MPSLVLRRLRGKQSVPAPVQPLAAGAGDRAIADEGWSELVALSLDSRRKHIHWTHIRTHGPSHVQPKDITRQAFWAHLERVHKDVYPEPANKTGSILLFGGVAKEFHAESVHAELRDEHHHAPTYSSNQHMWKLVAERSLSQYHIKMHAACHDGYSSMYEYVRRPSAKKPLSELDAEFFMSKDHPRGDALRRLLEAGAQSNRANAARRARRGAAPDAEPRADSQEPATKRMRVHDIFDLVREGGFRHALALQAHAHHLAAQGDRPRALWPPEAVPRARVLVCGCPSGPRPRRSPVSVCTRP